MRNIVLLLSIFSLTAGLAPAQERELFELKHLADGLAFQIGVPGRSYLGVGVAELDGARAKDLKLKEERGVEVKKVEADSPAEKAGLKEGDVVLEYNGQRVEGTESFIRMVRETPKGRTARMLISRDGNTQTLTATIGRRKLGEGRSFSLTIPPGAPMIDLPRPLMVTRTTRIGLETESLTGQLGEYFGVKDGVLVRSVEKDSPGEKAGLKAGDVIIKIDDDKVTRPRDISDAVRSADKKSVPVVIMRNKAQMTLNLELPERAGSTPAVRRRAISVREPQL
jgi:serine protease Do